MTFVPTKLYYKIREACDIAGVEAHVLRFWETEFPALAPPKSKSGQRTYRPKDIELILSIRKLLYEDGYTIAGARRQLGMRTPSESVKKRNSSKNESGPDSAIEDVISIQEGRTPADTGVLPMKDAGERCEPTVHAVGTTSEAEPISSFFQENTQRPVGTSLRDQEMLPRSILNHSDQALAGELVGGIDDGNAELKPDLEFVELRELPSVAPPRSSFNDASPTSSAILSEELLGIHKEALPVATPLNNPIKNDDEQEKPTSDRLKRVQAELENILTLLDRE